MGLQHTGRMGVWLNLIIMPLDPNSEFHGDNNNSSCICIFTFNTLVGRACNHFLWLSGAQFLNTDMKNDYETDQTGG